MKFTSTSHRGLQNLRRADRFPDRAGPHRHRRAERLRQIQSGRGDALGDGREFVEKHARVRHGRRDFLRRRRHGPRATWRKSRSSSTIAARVRAGAFNDADTIEVSRRIEREAGSAYRVNGREVRARDVQLLFADASSGARSPAMVRQGQIGEMISAKPAGSPPHPRRGRRRRRPAFAPPRGRIAPQSGLRQSAAPRRCSAAARRAGQRP